MKAELLILECSQKNKERQQLYFPSLLLMGSCLCCFRPPSLLFSACTSVSLKRSGGHIWRKTQQLPDEWEDLPQDRGHNPARYITVAFLTSQRQEYSCFHAQRLGGAKFCLCTTLVLYSACILYTLHHILQNYMNRIVIGTVIRQYCVFYFALQWIKMCIVLSQQQGSTCEKC